MNKVVLIVEQQLEISKLMCDQLRSNGYEEKVSNDLESALKMVKTFSFDVILAELDCVSLDGFELCRLLRNDRNDWTPIILISGKNEELDAVLGLELGADDYVIKPIKPKELMARIKSILRRGSVCCVNERRQNEHGLMYNGKLTLDPDHFMVYLDGGPIYLTRKEYEILYYLFSNKGKVLTRQQIINEFSADDLILDERIIDVFISRIRQKIEPYRKNPVYIKTVRQMGYVMNDIPVKETHKSVE